MASVYYVVDLSECAPEEIAKQLRAAARNIEIARNRDLKIEAAPVYGRDLEIGFSGHAGNVAAAHADMILLAENPGYRPEIIFAANGREVAVLRACAPDAKVEIEGGVADV